MLFPHKKAISTVAQNIGYLAYEIAMGIDSDTHALDGVWTGRYWLKSRERPGISCSVWLCVHDGRLAGSSLEPNKIVLRNEEELTADLRGHVQDQEVVFLKTYRTFEHEPIYFEGELQDCGKRIVGHWYFGWPNEWTGPFELSRKPIGASIASSKNSLAHPN